MFLRAVIPGNSVWWRQGECGLGHLGVLWATSPPGGPGGHQYQGSTLEGRV